VAGRLGSHKNIDVVLEAWQRHVDGDGWRGDELLLIGDGPLVIRTLPAYVRWRPGSYRYADVATTLAAAKGSVVHYRGASQSGVQLLSDAAGRHANRFSQSVACPNISPRSSPRSGWTMSPG